jgi:tetratricopeptide (TPR) repeat protein
MILASKDHTHRKAPAARDCDPSTTQTKIPRMRLITHFSRLLPALTLGIFLSAGAFAQETSNGDARAEYAAAVEAAQEAAAQGTAEGHLSAGDQYVAAAAAAEASGDADLEALATGVREAAVQSYADAAAAYASQDVHAEAAAAFLKGADVAESLGDSDLQTRLVSNAHTVLIQGGVALQRAGDVDGALAAFADVAAKAEAAGDDENFSRARETAGRILLVAANEQNQAGNHRGAIQELDRAAEFLAEDHPQLNALYATAYFRIGVSQVQAEQLTAARTSLQRAQQYARVAGRDQIVQGAQQQLDYIRQVLN